MANSPKEDEDDAFVLIPLRTGRGLPDAMVRPISLKAVLSSVLESCGLTAKQRDEEEDVDGAP